MRVLVACEFSGRVRDAFLKRGHDAVSCDLLPTEVPGPHIQDDVLNHLNDGWDMMIAHPPCTYLANSGVSHLYNKDKTINHERWQKMVDAGKFFQKLWLCNIPKICMENPIMHKYGKAEAGISFYYDTIEFRQVIQPWMFGHMEQKATCLWLKNLPKLAPTNNVRDQMMELPDNKRQRLHYLPPSKDRQTIRSRTFPGIAEAMAAQWGRGAGEQKESREQETGVSEGW